MGKAGAAAHQGLLKGLILLGQSIGRCAAALEPCVRWLVCCCQAPTATLAGPAPHALLLRHQVWTQNSMLCHPNGSRQAVFAGRICELLQHVQAVMPNT